MGSASATSVCVTPFSLKDAPSFIERLWPAQKISVEAQKERKANLGQTLTPLGSYWKGRKPLILVRACVLGSLLPATKDPVKDLEIFETLMRINDESFVFRATPDKPHDLVQAALDRNLIEPSAVSNLFGVRGNIEPNIRFSVDQARSIKASFSSVLNQSSLARQAISAALSDKWNYLEKVAHSERPEQIGAEPLISDWVRINNHLGTQAMSLDNLVEQLGIMRFGRRPKIADTFCGGGSIPFEAARLGADVYASDLNPIACMLTWGALNLIGSPIEKRRDLDRDLKLIAEIVTQKIAQLGVEHDEDGNQAKAFIYCVEVRCPQSGWLVPMLPSLVVSKSKRVVAKLVPDYEHKRFHIEIHSGVSLSELNASERGTVYDGNLSFQIDGERYQTSIKSLRGDAKNSKGVSSNSLRMWDVSDFIPRADDLFRERLYCVHWISADTIQAGRQATFFAAPSIADIQREDTVCRIVSENLKQWQEAGFVPDMAIEPGEKTNEPIRTRGWTHWHQLFGARHLLIAALVQEEIKKQDGLTAPAACILLGRALNVMSRMSRWSSAVGHDLALDVFYNQALNTFYNYGSRASISALRDFSKTGIPTNPIHTSSSVVTAPASRISVENDIYITDPPYADAVNYHEITEFFIAWLRRSAPAPLDQWTWDSRRPLAIKGDGQEFRTDMMAAYKAMSDHMPANGIQIVMFTHQSGSVWADMAQIFWGAGLQVKAAWYIATETTSELKKGGHVQGTVILVLRERTHGLTGFGDEIAQLVRLEVANQIDNLVGLNQTLKGEGRVENLFEDADLQMAGYAAALRVLTGYTSIDGRDMTAEALRPRIKGQKTYVDEIIEFAVQVANEHMVPEGLTPQLWERLSSSERFYLKMLDVEAEGISKLDNYQNFARAFRVADYSALMGSTLPNAANIKTAADYKKSDFASEFGQSTTRALLYAIWQISEDVDPDIVHSQLREFVQDYGRKRDDLVQLAQYIASRRDPAKSPEPRAANIVANLIRNERL